MKADDRDRAFGSVLGKALRGLTSGDGLIPILIALQFTFWRSALAAWRRWRGVHPLLTAVSNLAGQLWYLLASTFGLLVVVVMRAFAARGRPAILVWPGS